MFHRSAVAVGSAQAQSARQLLPTAALSDALIVAHRSSFNGMPLADRQDQGVTSMQAGFLVAPQAPVATQPRQMVQPLPTGTERTPVAVPQFDVALANAMTTTGPGGSGNGSGAAIRCRADKVSLTAMSVVTETATSKPVPMPGLPGSAAGSIHWSAACCLLGLHREGRERVPSAGICETSRASHPAEPELAGGSAPDVLVVRDGANGCCRRHRDNGRRRTEIARGRKAGQIASDHRRRVITIRSRHPCCQGLGAIGRRERCAASHAAIRRRDAAEFASSRLKQRLLRLRPLRRWSGRTSSDTSVRRRAAKRPQPHRRSVCRRR